MRVELKSCNKLRSQYVAQNRLVAYGFYLNSGDNRRRQFNGLFSLMLFIIVDQFLLFEYFL